MIHERFQKQHCIQLGRTDAACAGTAPSVLLFCRNKRKLRVHNPRTEEELPGRAVPPLNASATGTRWHRTKTTQPTRSCCTDGILQQPRYISLGSALGCSAPPDLLSWQHWKRPADPAAVRKSTLLRAASDKSPSIPSLFPDPRKRAIALQFTTPWARRKVGLEEDLFQTSPICSTLLSELFNTYRPSNQVGFRQPNYFSNTFASNVNLPHIHSFQEPHLF